MIRRQRAELVPARLLSFAPAEWARFADEKPLTLYKRWVAARREWVAEHPGSLALGTPLERLKFELETLHPGSTGRAWRAKEEVEQ